MLYPFFLPVIVITIIIIVVLMLNMKVNTKFECIKKRDSSDILIFFYLFSGIIKQKYKIKTDNISDTLAIIYELLLGEKGILTYGKEDSLKTGNKTDKDRGNNKIIRYLKPYLLKTQKYLVDRNKIYTKLNLKVVYGTNDAFLTGILGGLIFSIAGSLDSIFSNYFKVEEKNINIEPDFTKNVFEVKALCILSVRLVNIIKAGLFFLLKFINNKFKNKVRRWF